MLAKLLVLPLALLGGFLYRWRGGGFFPAPPRPIPQLLFDLFPCLVVAGFSAGFPMVIWKEIVVFLVFVLSVACECTGHGNFQDLGTYTKDSGDERVEFLIKWLKGSLPVYWYDALGLAVTGWIVTLPPGIVTVVFGHPLAGVLLALSGGLKAPGYMLGRFTADRFDLTTWTGAFGEFLSGFLRWLTAALILAFYLQ